MSDTNESKYHAIQVAMERGQLDLVDQKVGRFNFNSRHALVKRSLERLSYESDLFQKHNSFGVVYENPNFQNKILRKYSSDFIRIYFNKLPSEDINKSNIIKVQFKFNEKEQNYIKDIQSTFKKYSYQSSIVKALSRFMNDLEILNEDPNALLKYIDKDNTVLEQLSLRYIL